MFSMPFSTGALSVLRSAMAGSAHDPDGLDRLLTAFDGAQFGFSSELQSLLHQINPQLLQRLESMVAGGIALPQAARQLLSEGATVPQTGLPQTLPAGGGPTSVVEVKPDPLAVNATQDATVGRERLPRVPPGNVILALPVTSPTASPSVPFQPTTPLSGQPALTSQLTTSLLDMGVPQPVGGKDWQGAIGDRIVWMTQGDQQFARLTLNPPHLGPLEVRVSVSQDQTSVHFLAGHAAVRDALEAAIPRLRDLFDQQSLSLVHAEVSDPGAREDRHAGSSARDSAFDSGVGDANQRGQDRADEALEYPVARGRGLIDLFV